MAFDDFYYNVMGNQNSSPSATQFEKEQQAQALNNYNATRGYLFTSPHTTGNNLFSEQGYTNPVMNVQSTPISESTPATNVTPPSAPPTSKKRLSATDLTMQGIKDGTIGIASNNDDGSITYKDGTTRYSNGYAVTGKGVVVDPQGKYWTSKNPLYQDKMSKALGMSYNENSSLANKGIQNLGLNPNNYKGEYNTTETYNVSSPNDYTYSDLNNPNYNPNYIPADNIIAAAAQIEKLGLDPYGYFGYDYNTDKIDPNKITFTKSPILQTTPTTKKSTPISFPNSLAKWKELLSSYGLF